MNKRLLALACLALALWLLPLHAAAAPITLGRTPDHHALIRHLVGLGDPGGTLTIEEVARREFRPLSELELEGPGTWPGEPPPVVWMRFTTHVPPGETLDDWYLVIGRPYDPATIYVEQDDGGHRAITVGLLESGTSGRVELPATAGTRDVFLRIPRPASFPSLLEVATIEGHEKLMQGLLTEQGLYLGFMLLMLLVNLLVGVQLRDRAHLWYVGFIATSVVAFSLLTGTVSRFLLPTVPARDLARPQMASLALMVLMGIQFSRRFLDTSRTTPRIDRVMRGYLVLAAAVGLMTLVAPDLLALRAVALLGMLVPFVALSAGVASRRAGSRWARFYLVGWTLFTVGAFLFALPSGQTAINSLSVFQLSSVLEAALFSVALIDRMRVLRRERAQAELKVARAEKLASLGQLVAGVAHEVNNPNNFLTFNLPILQEYLDALRPHVEASARQNPEVRLFGLTVDEFFADAASLMGHMRHGTERIASLVAQLRSYVRQSDDPTQWEEVDVNRVVQNATTLVRTQVQKHVDRFDLRLAEGLPRVTMNPGRIEQVVMNLVLNAGHAAGSVASGRIEVRTERDEDHVCIAVEDTGPGVPDAIRDRIFEPFFTTKSGEQGTGMGLAISHRIVGEHGGTIELKSTAGRGACFVVRLPILREQT